MSQKRGFFHTLIIWWFISWNYLFFSFVLHVNLEKKKYWKWWKKEIFCIPIDFFFVPFTELSPFWSAFLSFIFKPPAPHFAPEQIGMNNWLNQRTDRPNLLSRLCFAPFSYNPLFSSTWASIVFDALWENFCSTKDTSNVIVKKQHGCWKF